MSTETISVYKGKKALATINLSRKSLIRPSSPASPANGVDRTSTNSRYVPQPAPKLHWEATKA
jgi:hypothetical protein